MSTRVQAHYFTDQEVEGRFEITTSKLRTAQRLGLIESLSDLVGQRYVRVWDELSLMKVYIADLFSAHTQVPFVVACQIACHYFDRCNRPGDLKKRLRHGAGKEEGGGRGPFPLICLLDRSFVFVKSSERITLLGLVTTGPDGRQIYNRFDSERTVEAIPDGISLAMFDPLFAIIEYRNLLTRD